jgi:N6-adenosine-specific RNA methylase IME4
MMGAPAVQGPVPRDGDRPRDRASLVGGLDLGLTPKPTLHQPTPSHWPTGSFGAIVVDRPAIFETYSEKGKGRSAERHYDCMTLEQTCRLPVPSLAAPDCALFMWTTWPTLRATLTIIDAWSFRYKTVGFVWVKQSKSGRKLHFGMGFWTRSNTEVCLLATKGRPRRLAADVQQVIISPLREHSRKPDEIYPRIERLIAGPYVELFARHRWPGWTAWGDELTDDPIHRARNP